ncbi:hypothetical protein ACWD5R_33440 [Streptomyces sp. NPDC002514]|uniref:hypothetical protein n=1 Tax=Streptomyces sp. NPDC001270 TaxID=3364554 RepID=UPI00369E5418
MYVVEGLLSDRSPLQDATPGIVAEEPHSVLVGLLTAGPPSAEDGWRTPRRRPSARWPTACGPVLHR